MKELPYSELRINNQLRLVQLSLDDADQLFALTDAHRDYLGQYLPWVSSTVSANDSRQFIQRMLDQRQAGEEYGYGIEYDGQIVGHTSLMHLKDAKTPEIGYWISADVQGKGIVTSVATALTEFAITTLGLEKVIIRADVRNAASNRVAEKCGYLVTATGPDEDGDIMNTWTLLNPAL